MCQTFNAENKYAPCITDNADLRVILSVLYTMLEVIRCYDKELADNRLMPPPPAPPPPQAASGSSSSTSFSSASIGSQKELLEKYAQMREQLKSDLSMKYISLDKIKMNSITNFRILFLFYLDFK